MHSTACLRCHRRKVRCDRSLPQCSPCARAKVTCQYTTSEHQHRRQHLQRLEQRIRQLETDNNSLAAQLRSSQDRPVANSDPQPAVTPQHEENIGARDDGVAEQVVHASLVAGGGHHFVGSTSGLLLATLLQSGHSSSSVFPIPTQQAGGGPEQSRHSPYTDSNRPPKGLARDLLQAYRAHDHLCYPYISTKTLFQCLDSVYDGNNDDPVEAFFVDMALAIGTAQAHRLKWNGIYDSEAHLHRAMTRLTDVLARGGVQRLQALLLICQYKMGSTSSSTTPSVWHLIGVAARTCLEMGLHRASTYSLPVVPTGSTNENYDTTLQARREEMETKKKCFWSLVALDRVVSLALGRPFAIQLEDIDIDLSDGLPIDNQQETCSPAALSEYSRQDQIKTSAFVYIVRYRLICGKISNALHRASRVKGDSVNLLEARDSLATELQEWYSGTAKLPLSPRDNQALNELPTRGGSCFLSEEWYRLLYHNGMLMLYRPSPYLCDASHNSATLQHLFHSSREAIHLYSSLHRSRKLNYSWITMHTIFLAGLSYIYALRNHFQSIQAQATQPILTGTPTITEVVNDTRACSKVLLAVAERQDIARNCSELFDRLSDALITDVFAAQSTSTGFLASTPVPHFTAEASSMNAPGEGFHNQVPESSSINMNMAIDSTFRDYFSDLQNLGFDELHNDALSQLSQEWFLGLNEDRAFLSSLER
ncbi:hypothetical protein P170DRAFT_415029 [Aspergillus steynii IBT 23096]|uniref:Zn(2)-C6 fungal-type domain-containing protein n=1 Tax=Aspergillus steynii IBT 23096 TaxID=1392250 RepID=A0A2I2FZS8_9EURO|nr:uncharacterized protein P170DRAFT_415029 [Aspergillus steynii IBT 23096]PLB46140.1 hypothetical protein P170DRAFT_415029 [Aspergillus steynii IBT 23096]